MIIGICGLIGMTDIMCGTFHSIGHRLLNKFDYLSIFSCLNKPMYYDI